MDVLIKGTTSFCFAFMLSSCQLTYYWKQAQGQLELLNQRVPIAEALKDPRLTEQEKLKLTLANEARRFSEEHFGMTKTKNYTRYVHLNRPYVTYVVNAAEKWKLKSHLWKFPIVGEVPYKGYFSEPEAQAEQALLVQKNLDTYVRGVSAYSTLGWFEDPILSSMLAYKEHDLVNTIIHETTHATLYIKSSADFNERLAVFVGNKGTELFYLNKEGSHSPTVKLIEQENADEKLFSQFITAEIKDLEKWYENYQGEHIEDIRQSRIAEIQKKFEAEILPELKTKSYAKFGQISLNNARLMLYKTYVQDLTLFEELYKKVGHDLSRFLIECKKLERHPNPEKGLRELLAMN